MLLQHPFKLQCLVILSLGMCYILLTQLPCNLFTSLYDMLSCRNSVFCYFPLVNFFFFSLHLASNYLRWDRGSYSFLCLSLGPTVVRWLGICPTQLWLVGQSEIWAEFGVPLFGRFPAGKVPHCTWVHLTVCFSCSWRNIPWSTLIFPSPSKRAFSILHCRPPLSASS